jgi:hypothetical protein
MNALPATPDAIVQMIDTCAVIPRCIDRNRKTVHGPVAKAVTSKIHAMVDSSGLPVRLLERFFNKIKQCRRVATRYDKFAASYLTFSTSSIRVGLGVN